jgi:uncharacterized protein (TIGR02594 family)
MTRITREAFVNTLAQEGGGLDVARMSAHAKTALTSAGLDAHKLSEIAGKDGKIATRAEYDRLFTLLDGLDHNGSRHSVDTSVRRNGCEQQTASGRALNVLVAGLAEQRLTAHLAGAPATAPASERAPTMSSGGPPWLDVVRGEMGVREIAGKENNARIVEYHASTKGKARTDEVAWCSSFANWAMEKAGIQGPDSARALDWLKWGQSIPGPALGAVAVIDWHNGGKGHVGFVVGRSGDRVVLAGGNQGDAVQFRTYKLSQIASFRVPGGYQVPAKDYNLPQMNVRIANESLATTR